MISYFIFPMTILAIPMSNIHDMAEDQREYPEAIAAGLEWTGNFMIF